MDNELITKMLSFIAIVIVSTAILLAMLPFGVGAPNVVVPEEDKPEDENPKIELSKISSGCIEVTISDTKDGIRRMEYGDLGTYTKVAPASSGQLQPFNPKTTRQSGCTDNPAFNKIFPSFKNKFHKSVSFGEWRCDSKKTKRATIKFCSTPGGPMEFKLAALDCKGNWDIISVRQKCDYGDAPDPKYPSLYASNGARHFNNNFEWLGKAVNKESDSKQVDQDGDDGVTFYPPYLGGVKNKVKVVITTSGQANRYNNKNKLCLDAWFDWNNNGKWEEKEKTITKNYNPSTWGKGVTSKKVTIDIVPPENQPKDMWVRFRLSYGKQSNKPKGVSLFGEVEDYKVSVNAKDYNPKTEFVSIRNTRNNSVQKAKIGQSLRFIGFNSPPKIYKRSDSGKIERAGNVTQIGEKYFLFNVNKTGCYGVNCKKPGEKREDSVIGYKGKVKVDAVFIIAKIETSGEEISVYHCEDGAYGDANEDGKIDDADLYYMWQILCGDQPDTTLADANYDGLINEDDMFYIAQIIETERLQYPLTLEISTEYKYMVKGTLAQSLGEELVILYVPPKGDFWIQEVIEKISEEDGVMTFLGGFYYMYNIDEVLPVGYYDIYALHPGFDGVWGASGEKDLETVLDEYLDRPILEIDEIQDEINDILEKVIYDSYSDDLIALSSIRVETPYVELDPIEDVFVGESLIVTGITNRQKGYTQENCWIVLTCIGAVELVPCTSKVENSAFEAIFDTMDAVPGEYTVMAEDIDYGYTDEKTVNIWG